MTGMKLSKSTLVFILLFILILGYSIYNDKIKPSLKKDNKKTSITYSNDYTKIDTSNNYDLYQRIDNINNNYITEYKYIIYDNNKKIIDEQQVDSYTHIYIKDNILEVKINYGKSIISKIYDIAEGKILLEKQNVYLYNDKYIVFLNNDNIEIQDIYNKDKYYKKEKLDKDIINNIKSIKFIKDNKVLRILYISNDEEEKYDIRIKR